MSTMLPTLKCSYCGQEIADPQDVGLIGSSFVHVNKCPPVAASPPPSQEGLEERLLKPLPVCPYDRRSPEYWVEHAICPVCHSTEDGPDLCRGADTRIMDEAAAELSRLRAELTERPDWDTVNATYEKWKARAEAAEATVTRLTEALTAVVVTYKRDNFMRTADMHDPSCTCMRCAIDHADAALRTEPTDGE